MNLRGVGPGFVEVAMTSHAVANNESQGRRHASSNTPASLPRRRDLAKLNIDEDHCRQKGFLGMVKCHSTCYVFQAGHSVALGVTPVRREYHYHNLPSVRGDGGHIHPF